VLCDKTAVFGDGIKGTACSSICELPTFLSACSPHYTLRPSPYRAVNTLRLGYKNQSVNVV
jgi:hypothetical protein